MKRSELHKRLGAEIKRLRKERGLTQAEVANALKLGSAGFICDVEKGRRTISVWTLYRLEKLIGYTWGDFE